MNVILIHGDDTVTSLARFMKLISVARERNWEIIRLDSDSFLDLPEKLSSTSLFENERLFAVDNFKNLSKKDLDWIKKNADRITGTLLIYSPNTLNKTNIDSLGRLKKIEDYKLKRNVFVMLESIIPGNSKQILKLLKDTNEPIEFVFSLISKHLRDLYWIKSDPNSLHYPTWRLSKLRSQAEKFTDNKLKILINNLAEIDILTKTSKHSLEDELDIAILSIL